MNVQVNVPQGIDMEKVLEFLSKLKFTNLSIQEHGFGKTVQMIVDVSDGEYCINVLEYQEDLTTAKLQSLIDSSQCGIFLFKPEVETNIEPKVVFTTDHSNQATKNLSKFKSLKPAGFSGATVIEGIDESAVTGPSNEFSRNFLDRMKSTVLSIQANLIIANFDLGKSGRNMVQMSNLVNVVTQNKCHVLILKA